MRTITSRWALLPLELPLDRRPGLALGLGLGLALGAALLSARALHSQDVVISELMATNVSTIDDADGDTSDYIELFNAGAGPVNLAGWRLTDDPGALAKWTFPAVTLEPGAFLLVFASDKDRRDPAAQLHTNFKLSSLGEYLALVNPTSNVVWEYAPYPEQVVDFSYGLRMDAGEPLNLVAAGAAAEAFVPADDSLGLSWTEADFTPLGWTAGPTGVGYDRNPDYLPLIGTSVRTAMDGVNTSCYIRIPFEVEAPASISSLSLRMKYDDGFVAYINGQKVAQRNAPASPTWNSTATGLHDDAQAIVFEAIQIIGIGGLLRAGTNVLAIHGLNDNPGSSDFLILPELDGFESGTLDRTTAEFFPKPSPGFANFTGVPGVTLPPTIEPEGGLFAGSIQVILGASSQTGTLRYTTDGSEPGAASAIYSAPLELTGTTILKARVFETDGSVSPSTSASFVTMAQELSTFSSNLPLMVLENFGAGGVPQNTFQPVYFAIFEPGVDGRATLVQPPTIATRAGIKVRGSSTAGTPKQSFTLETWGARDNEDRAIEPLGLPKESDWVLHAPYDFDRALMRNPLIFELSNEVGRYAVRTRFVEVFVNTGGGNLSNADYAGVYNFMEKIKRGPERVDVEKLTSADETEPRIQGGYMMKIDRLDPGDSGFNAAGFNLAYVYPKEDVVTGAQATWLRDYMNAFYAALQGPSFTHPTLGYAPYVNTDSWIDHHLLNVLPKNVDALRLSTYFYKSRFGKIEYGPIWDFDRSMNSTDGRDDDPRTWNGTGDGTRYFEYPWWSRLFQDPEFYQRYRDRWYEHRLGPFSNNNIRAVIDEMAATVQEAQARDGQRWGRATPASWALEITNLKNWLTTRANWIDTQFPSPPTFNKSGGAITPGFELTIAAPSGTIYYTADGRDPRAPGGGIAPGAMAYGGPVTLNGNARVVARALLGPGDWTSPRDATFFVSLPRLVVAEVMYHPQAPSAGSPFDADDLEFIELVNADVEPIVLAGARLAGGVSFVFPGTDLTPLQPDERVLVVKSLDAFASVYSTAGLRIAGEYDGNLNNAGEALEVFGPLGEPVLSFAYSDQWYPTTDGLGDSLNIKDPSASLSSWSSESSWMASSLPGGTPGRPDPGSGAGGLQLPSDSNQDGALDLADGISLLWRLFVGGVPLPCEGATLEDGGNLRLLDSNGDLSVDVSDTVHLLSYLFQGGPPPALGVACVRLSGCPETCGR